MNLLVLADVPESSACELQGCGHGALRAACAGIAGELIYFSLLLRDKYGNPCRVRPKKPRTGHSEHVPALEQHERGPGAQRHCERQGDSQGYAIKPESEEWVSVLQHAPAELRQGPRNVVAPRMAELGVPAVATTRAPSRRQYCALMWEQSALELSALELRLQLPLRESDASEQRMHCREGLPAECCEMRAGEGEAAAAGEVRIGVLRWRAGVYEASVLLGGEPVPGLVTVHVSPAALHAPSCNAHGAQLSRCIAGVWSCCAHHRFELESGHS